MKEKRPAHLWNQELAEANNSLTYPHRRNRQKSPHFYPAIVSGMAEACIPTAATQHGVGVQGKLIAADRLANQGRL
jgi:hypothetical protein